MKQTSYSTAKTVEKALRLIEFVRQEQPVRPVALATHLGLTRSNVHRLLATLEELSYVEKSIDGAYRLGLKVFLLGSGVMRREELLNAARGNMIGLSELANENVNLGVRLGHEVLYLEKIERPHLLKLDQVIGGTDPLYCTALGKVLLSGLDVNSLQRYLKKANLAPLTPMTITAPNILIKHLDQIRRKGYATDLEELSVGIHCIAAPIKDHDHKVIAALSVSAPAIRLTRTRIAQIRNDLLHTVKDISTRLGCQP